MTDELLVLTGDQVAQALDGREAEILETVAEGYRAHARGQTSLPHSSFLRFPGDVDNRIIALPGYLGTDGGTAGLKWISSFPFNVDRGLERASAVILLNSLATGRAHALLEGSLISARRTAASAALAARHLHNLGEPATVGLVGCGRINYEVLRFLRALPEARVASVLLYDLDPARAEGFIAAWRARPGEEGPRLQTTGALDQLLAAADLVSFATTAIRPHVRELGSGSKVRTILHISLRDLDPRLIVQLDNVVDDVDHVLRAGTSLQLAEDGTGRRDFIRCTIGDILNGAAPGRTQEDAIVAFSPFGLGVLDLAVARLALASARGSGSGTVIRDFWQPAWNAPGTFG